MVALIGVLVAINLLNHAPSAAPENAALHQDIVQNRSGAEVTFDATALTNPVDSGGHERLEVSDPAGDQLELDYNLDLGSWIPVSRGEHLLVHGQLYIDPGMHVGVHCLHAHTSAGCPLPGWIEYRGTLYQ